MFYLKLNKMSHLIIALLFQQTHNKKQPDWLNADTLKRLNYIQKTYKVKWWYPTHEMAVLKGGKFAQFILLILLHGRVLKVTVVELS